MGMFDVNRVRSYEDEVKDVKIYQLREYYREKELTIIGLNDSQGVNTTMPFKKGVLEYLAQLLKDENNSATIINAFSLMFNKTEHIDYFLESNLSVEEIKDLQVAAMVGALEKAMIDFHVPKFVGKLGYVSKMLYRKKKGDNDILLTDSIRYAKEPIIIYSCGANDLMREGWNNPFSIGRDYKNREKNDNYNYTLKKFEDSNTVKKVIGNVERNFNNILGLNSNADIFTLGIYIPKSMQSEGMEIFNSAIEEYNGQLEELCKKYGIRYIDTEANGQKYNKSKTNFHVSTAGHYALAETIAEELFKSKLGIGNEISRPSVRDNLRIYNNGLIDILINLKHDIAKLKNDSVIAFGREADIYQEKIQEVERQKDIVENVIIKRM